MKKFFLNVITKSVILTILPLFYPSLFFYALSLNKSIQYRNDIIVISVVMLIIHMAFIFYYGFAEHKQNKSFKELKNVQDKAPKEVLASSALLQKYCKIIKDNSDKLYEKIKEKKGHSDIVDWQWMQAKGDEICEELHRFISTIAENGNNFGF